MSDETTPTNIYLGRCVADSTSAGSITSATMQ